MKVNIVPLLKKRNLDPKCKNNYRPIALATVISKLYEKMLLSRYSKYLKTKDNQFGFKKATGCELCVFTLRQVISHYTTERTPLYICYLDASKAFDNVDFSLLLNKIKDRGIPQLVVEFFRYWFHNQQFQIKWGLLISALFSIEKGVRQGGILSPLFFAVYLDEMSAKLKRYGMGCNIAGNICNLR